MLTRIYKEALLAYEELADQVWEAWDGGGVSTYWLTGSDRSGHRQISYNRGHCKES